MTVRTATTPLGMYHALLAANEMVRQTGLDVLAAKLEGNRKAERRAYAEQTYWIAVSRGWEADLRALSQRVVLERTGA